MTNDQLIVRIEKWQKKPVFHELTCGEDSAHEVLEGKVENDQVILYCPTCGYKQEHVPTFFFAKDFDDMYERQRELIEQYKMKPEHEKND